MNKKKYNLDEIKQKIEKANGKTIEALIEGKKELEDEIAKFAVTMSETLAISTFISYFLKLFEKEED